MPQHPTTSQFDVQQPRVHDRTLKHQTEPPEVFEFDDKETMGMIKQLSRPTGVILMTAGVVGLIIPGILGTPLLLAGGLVLAPKTFGKVDDSLKQRFPEFRRQGVQAMGRFLADMQKRYPSSAGD